MLIRYHQADDSSDEARLTSAWQFSGSFALRTKACRTKLHKRELSREQPCMAT